MSEEVQIFLITAVVGGFTWLIKTIAKEWIANNATIPKVHKIVGEEMEKHKRDEATTIRLAVAEGNKELVEALHEVSGKFIAFDKALEGVPNMIKIEVAEGIRRHEESKH